MEVDMLTAYKRMPMVVKIKIAKVLKKRAVQIINIKIKHLPGAWMG